MTETPPLPASQRVSWVARAWRVALAHLRGGETPVEELDLGGPASVPEREHDRRNDAIDESVDESFPASDPPSWTSSHA